MPFRPALVALQEDLERRVAVDLHGPVPGSSAKCRSWSPRKKFASAINEPPAASSRAANRKISG